MSKEQVMDADSATAMNRLARERMKLRLMLDIKFDMTVCELEGWDKREHIRELQGVLNGFKV